MPNTYLFVIATQYNQSDFWTKAKIGPFLEKGGFTNSVEIIYENKEALTKVYNSFITEKNKDKKIIFVHDDVFIEDMFLTEKLDIAFEKLSIVGLAGSKKCNLSSQAPAWHLMSDRSDHVGEVGHCHDKKVWTTIFGPTDARALVLDGLFIAVDVNKLLETKTFFDERFSFHHYDISFCLNANNNKLKMGVAPIRVVHFGLGDSMNTPEWHESAKKFKEYYK